MKLKNYCQAAILGSSLLLASLSFAAPGQGHGQMPPAHKPIPVKMMLKKLELNQNQKQELKEPMARYKQQKQELIKKMRANHKQLIKMVGADYDASKVQDISRAQGSLSARLAQLQIAFMHNVYHALDGKQQAKMMKLLEKKHFGKKHRGFKGRKHKQQEV